MKIILLHPDKCEGYYRATVEFNGVVFESVYIKKLEDWSSIFNTSLSSLKKLVKSNK